MFRILLWFWPWNTPMAACSLSYGRTLTLTELAEAYGHWQSNR